jgi:competence protein ComEC
MIPLIAGLAFWLATGCRLPGWAALFVLPAVSVPLCLSAGRWGRPYGRRWCFGLWVFLALFLLGWQLGQQRHQARYPGHFSTFHGETGFLLLRLVEPPAVKPNSYQVVGRVVACLSEGTARRTRGKLMLYLQKDNLAAALQYGDVILTSNAYQEVEGPPNPDQFDYRRFLARGNLFHSAYRPSASWVATGERRGAPPVRLALKLRQQAMDIFQANGLDGQEFAVLSALFLGFRDSLDEDLQKAFAGAGAMHVLCVSGLHVGILFLVFQALFSFLKRWPRGRWLQGGLVVAFVWMYAALTGFSPSVMRASAMFSFVAAGQHLGRRTSVYNTLSASALVLLLADPGMLGRIGFQLSYLAVLGIVSLQPSLQQWLAPRHPLPRKAWALATVSLAAQLATGPLALFYFNQFPLYFLLTNILAIPLAGLIIHLALICLCLSYIPAASLLAGNLLSWALRLLNTSVAFVEGLPGAVWSPVYVSLPETFLVYLVICLVFLYLIRDNRAALLWGLACLLLLSASASFRQTGRQRQGGFAVYHVNRATSVDFFAPGRTIWLRCARGASQPDRARGYLQGHRLRRMGRSGVVEVNLSAGSPPPEGNWLRQGPLLLFFDKVFLIPGREGHPPPEGIRADYLLLCQNPPIDLADWILSAQPGLVIMDLSSPRWVTDRWTALCDSLGVEAWPVHSRGGYAASFSLGEP